MDEIPRIKVRLRHLDDSKDWTEYGKQIREKVWQSGLREGVIVGRSGSHGLCYRVEFDGMSAFFNPGELELI